MFSPAAIELAPNLVLDEVTRVLHDPSIRDSHRLEEAESRVVRQLMRGNSTAAQAAADEPVAFSRLLGRELFSVRVSSLRMVSWLLHGRLRDEWATVWRLGVVRRSPGGRPDRVLAGALAAAFRSHGVVAWSIAVIGVWLAASRSLGVWEVVAALCASGGVMVSLAVHEACHLATLRIVRADHGCGGLVYGPLRLAVRRPRLTGTALRATAAAGPLGGATVSILVLAIPGIATTVCGVLCACFHLANLAPWASDGRQFWTGIDE